MKGSCLHCHPYTLDTSHIFCRWLDEVHSAEVGVRECSCHIRSHHHVGVCGCVRERERKKKSKCEYLLWMPLPFPDPSLPPVVLLPSVWQGAAMFWCTCVDWASLSLWEWQPPTQNPLFHHGATCALMGDSSPMQHCDHHGKQLCVWDGARIHIGTSFGVHVGVTEGIPFLCWYETWMKVWLST